MTPMSKTNNKSTRHWGMRSGTAVAAQHRNGGAMKHRLTPRGGARNEQASYFDELEDDGEE